MKHFWLYVMICLPHFPSSNWVFKVSSYSL